MLLNLFVVFSFIFFLWSFFRIGRVSVSFLLGFVFFFSIQYGPHTVFLDGMMRMAVPGVVSRDVESIYALLMAIVYLMLGFLFFLTPKKVFKLKAHKNLGECVAAYKKTIFTSAFLLIFLSAALQGGVGIFVTHLKFMLGDSIFSYKEIRRELFADTAWSSWAALVRYTVLPLVGGGLFLMYVKSKKAIRYFYFFMSIFTPLFCAIQLNKLFYFYYTALYFFIFFCERKFFGVPELNLFLKLSRVFKVSIFGFLVMLGIFYLYSFQYSAELEQGILTEDRIMGTQIYRIFLTSSDGIRLWIDYFAERFEPNGISSVGKVCSLFGECLNSNTIIPFFYLGEDLTTIQTGFVGSALSFGGLFAVPFFVFFAYLLVILNNAVLSRFLGGDVAYIIAGTGLINSLFLTTREIATAMISGGVFVIPMVAILLIYVRRRNRGWLSNSAVAIR